MDWKDGGMFILTGTRIPCLMGKRGFKILHIAQTQTIFVRISVMVKLKGW